MVVIKAARYIKDRKANLIKLRKLFYDREKINMEIKKLQRSNECLDNALLAK